MNRRQVLGLLGAIGAGLSAGARPVYAGTTHQVKIKGFAFQPATL